MILSQVEEEKQALFRSRRRRLTREGRRGGGGSTWLERAILCIEDFCNWLNGIKPLYIPWRALISRHLRTICAAMGIASLPASP